MSLLVGNRQPFRSGGPFLGRVPWRQLGSPWGAWLSLSRLLQEDSGPLLQENGAQLLL